MSRKNSTRSVFRKVILVLICGSFLAQCAQVRPPSGGPKDENPPKIDTTFPPNFSVNFDSDKIRIVFNENIRLNNISEQLIVSPRLEFEPKVSVKKGRMIDISLDGDLDENSTYTLNFGNSVEDLTEGNKAADLNFVFSTGGHLDSLHVLGTLLNAYTGLPEEDAMVLLYAADDTASLRTAPPLYFTRANELGIFHLKHLKNIPYRIFALKDLNFNYLYDLPNEQIAFLDSIIHPQQLDSTTGVIPLRMFEARSNEQFIKHFDFGPMGKIQVSTNLPTDSLDFIVDHNRFSKKNMITEVNKTKDTVTYWMLDTANVNYSELYFFDGEMALDTINIDKPPIKKADLKLNVKTNVIGTLGPRQRLVLEAQRPVESYNAHHMNILADDDTIHFSIVPLDSVQRKFWVDLERQEAAKYQIELYPGAFVDIYGRGIDSTTFTLGQREPDHYGNLILALNVPTTTRSYILELVTERDRVVERTVISEAIIKEYDRIDPGNYRLRLIVDDNNNGKWDTGDLDSWILPEKVYYYSEKIVVRSGWDLDLEWTISF